MSYRVLINGEPAGTIEAASYAAARVAARRLYRVTCDIIGSK